MQSPYTLDSERAELENMAVTESSVVQHPAWKVEFSSGITWTDFLAWFQAEAPVFFCRLRPWPSEQPNPLNDSQADCLVFPAGTSLNEAQEKGLGFIQDWASQKTVEHEELAVSKPLSIWDACSGAGGKSLQMNRLYPHHHWVCTDLRASALNNLQQRFLQAGFKLPLVFPFNPAKKSDFAWQGPEHFDRIVLDVPCSGSGTWRRNPEEWHRFSIHSQEKLWDTQRVLLQNCASRLLPGGLLFYLTCSVFQRENEDQVNAFLQNNPDYFLLSMEMLGGPSNQADYLFRAVLKRNETQLGS